MKSRKIILTLILLIEGLSLSFGQQLKNGDFFEVINGLKINYSIRGKGPVMIVGHLNSGKIGYQLSLRPLEKKFTMVYYEPRGTGKSEAPIRLDDYNQDSIVSEIEGLRKRFKVNKVWIFGHSDQSSIALIYALKYPNNVEGLILTGTHLVGTRQETYQLRKNSEAKRIRESSWFEQVVKDWDYMYNHNTDKDSTGKDISDAPLKWWCYNEESAEKVIPLVKQIDRAGRRKPIDGKFWTESDEELEKYFIYQKKFIEIKNKILIINGKYDTANPPEFVQKLHNILSNSKLVIIDKAGHFPWVENSATTFNEINKWLKKIS